MLAASFIALNLGNLGFIIGGFTLGISCLVIARAEDVRNSKYGSMPFVAFAIFFIGAMGIYGPHQSTVDHRHHVQAVRELPLEYASLKVVDLSVSDHWVQFQLPQCGDKTYQYDELRRIGGHYFFATPVVKKDKDGQKYTDYQAIKPGNLSAICQTSTITT
ncbi:MAG TPA: hypothetical protein VMT23_03180 [Candidatus Binatia bacterium]|nr:hypothetical protein [Candidatus Binatia bacterium]